MLDRTRREVAALVVVGTLVRLILIATTHGEPYDMQSFRAVALALSHVGLHVYEQPAIAQMHRWPYPPVFFGWISLADALHGHLLRFDQLIRLPAVAADAVLACLMARALRGQLSDRAAVAGAGLIALGPSFIVISGYHGQIDAVAILPGVLATLIWQRGSSHRAWRAGALIGLAAAIKTVPVLLVLALLPTIHRRREALALLVGVAAVAGVCSAPFLIVDLAAMRHALDYGGIPGAGGLSLVLQPGLARSLLGMPERYSTITDQVILHQMDLNLVVVALLAVLFTWRRPAVMRAAVMLWLAVWLLGSGFFFQYLVWGLPFLILAGYLRAAAALQVAVLIPTLVFYLAPWHAQAVVVVYVAIMLATWLAWGAGLVGLCQRADSSSAELLTV